MKFKIFNHRQLLLLGIALGFLFFGWNAAEQYLTSFYQTADGQTSTALNALAILYAAIIIGNFLGPIITKKLGLRISLIFGFLTYTLLVFGVVSKITFLIYFLSALLGFGSGVMGLAQADLIRISSPSNLRGELTGSINALRTIGGGAGVLIVGLLVRFFEIETISLGLGTVMIVGIFTLLFFKEPTEVKLEQKEKIFLVIQKTFLMFKELRIILVIPLLVANGFLLGLILGAIPASITQNYGIEYVGLTMPLFHLTLSFSGFYSGRLSDKIGRFPILYFSIISGVAAATAIIFIQNVFPLIFAMILAGFFSATNGVVTSALFIDMFGEKVKEALAASGIIATLLGIVPAFILNKTFSTQILLYLSIAFCFIGLVCLKILETKLTKEKA